MPKLKFLAEQGFELCNHTLWHAQLSKYDDAVVQEQIARLALAVDSAVPGYQVRTFALPLGVWPKDRALAAQRILDRSAHAAHAGVLACGGVAGGGDAGAESVRPGVRSAQSSSGCRSTGTRSSRRLAWLEKPGRRYVV